MVHQTHPLEQSEKAEPLRSVARNTSEFAEDILTLAELQFQLFSLDCRECAGTQVRPAMYALAGGLLALGLVPICFLALAATLIEYVSLSPAQALGVSLAVGAMISGTLLICASRAFKSINAPFARTQREWDSNIRWFRNMMRRQGRRW